MQSGADNLVPPHRGFARLDDDIVEAVMQFIDPLKNQLDNEEYDATYEEGRDFESLSSMCLISKIWLTPARRRLYRSIPYPFTSEPLIEKVMDTLIDCSHLRPLVHKLYYNLDVSEDVHERFASTLLPLLPNCLVMASTGHEPRESHWLLNTSALGSLEVACDLRWSPAEWTMGFQKWHQLKTLRFYFLRERISYVAGNEVDQHSVPSLTCLAWFGCRGVIAPPTCPNTLHTLSIRQCGELDTRMYDTLVSRHASSLRCLELEGVFFTGPEYLFHEVVAKMTGLQSLLLGDIHLSADIFAVLPQSIEEVVLDGRLSISKKSCRDFVQLRVIEGGRLRSFLYRGDQLVGVQE
jgi:hypothetical protein